jgi:riboflavin kinase/FMN adenylyltransferase
VATLGVFDGVHRGHQAVIGRLTGEADTLGCRPAVITFDRHPGSVVHDAEKPSITSLGHRLHLFESLGVGLSVVLRFESRVAEMAPEEFVRTVFGELVQARRLVLGFDCRFGRGRAGDVELCRRMGPDMGFDVVEVAPVEVGGEAVHSTRVRRCIADGRLREAAELLGRRFSLYGTVVHGDSRGRRLGYPTANLNLHNELLPPDGVYAARACRGQDCHPAVLSIGTRSTFHDEAGPETAVEVHLLDYRGDLYGANLEVRLVERLRGQERFGSAEALVEQIEEDIRRARAVLQGE